MILVIAEKPSVAQIIAKVLGASSRKDGYIEGNNYIVSWCVGHFVGRADASAFDERYAKWKCSDLPIVPKEWLFELPKHKANQFNTLKRLMNNNRFICDDDCRNCPIADECEDFIPCPDDVDCADCPYYCNHCNRCVFDE